MQAVLIKQLDEEIEKNFELFERGKIPIKLIEKRISDKQEQKKPSKVNLINCKKHIK